MKRKPIAAYCKQVEGWLKVPDLLNAAYSGEEQYTCAFLRKSDGLHMMASVKDFSPINVIHVSLTPIRSMRPDWTDDHHGRYLFDVAHEVIESFFPGRKFAQQPVDPRRPEMKHYFSVLED